MQLPWSHYVRLLSVKNLKAIKFYETEAVAHYALDNLPNILAAEYQLKLPDEQKLAVKIEEARKSIEEEMLPSQEGN
ncbi:hypothetical protein I8751_04345 [Nostocaceae cyanobacterium CENA357]|uniref:YhcG N-terminal domain-containing protein n=1 Tax=Atlanticothrix silvestris CENA357 TaxID=1725252 RepID=A0A8J7KWT8_9CYAN|nr:hypothetical protein [Atlanticothrix silvestris]MBH8551615.1 hypothetical protein [Atlanticothrix silvestris CENA357]